MAVPGRSDCPIRGDRTHRSPRSPSASGRQPLRPGTTFDRAGRYHHLFVPRTGRSAAVYSAVTVFAERATVADALSTALSVMPRERAPAVLRRFPGVDAWVVEADGRLGRLGTESA
jgi:ApbE family